MSNLFLYLIIVIPLATSLVALRSLIINKSLIEYQRAIDLLFSSAFTIIVSGLVITLN